MQPAISSSLVGGIALCMLSTEYMRLRSDVDVLLFLLSPKCLESRTFTLTPSMICPSGLQV